MNRFYLFLFISIFFASLTSFKKKQKNYLIENLKGPVNIIIEEKNNCMLHYFLLTEFDKQGKVIRTQNLYFSLNDSISEYLYKNPKEFITLFDCFRISNINKPVIKPIKKIYESVIFNDQFHRGLNETFYYYDVHDSLIKIIDLKANNKNKIDTNINIFNYTHNENIVLKYSINNKDTSYLEKFIYNKKGQFLSNVYKSNSKYIDSVRIQNIYDSSDNLINTITTNFNYEGSNVETEIKYEYEQNGLIKKIFKYVYSDDDTTLNESTYLYKNGIITNKVITLYKDGILKYLENLEFNKNEDFENVIMSEFYNFDKKLDSSHECYKIKYKYDLYNNWIEYSELREGRNEIKKRAIVYY